MQNPLPSYSALKAAQALNFFLSESANDPEAIDGDSYLKLIKLLWAADRFSLRNFGHTVTGDRYAALNYGPVASHTYDLMKVCVPGKLLDSNWVKKEDGELWQAHFEKRPDYKIGLIADPGAGQLSPADVMMLERAYSHFRKTGRFEVANDISHIYPEWERAFPDKPGSQSSYPIEMADFFDDPSDKEDLHFQVDQETLEAARFFFNERKELSEAIGIPL